MSAGELEAWETAVADAGEAAETMGGDGMAPFDWPEDVPMPGSPGEPTRVGCELWLTVAYSCVAYLEGGDRFDQVVDDYVVDLAASGWHRSDREDEVVGQVLQTFVRDADPEATLWTVSTGDYGGRTPGLLIRLVRAVAGDEPTGAHPAPITGVLPDEYGIPMPLPWPADGTDPVAGPLGQFCLADLLLDACRADAVDLVAYAAQLGAEGWSGPYGGGSVTTFRDPLHGDSAVMLLQDGSSASVRAFLDVNGS